MRCDKFEMRLHDLLDHRCVPQQDSQLREHAAACPTCNRLLQSQEILFDVLEMRELPELDDGFAARVVAEFGHRDLRTRRQVVSGLAAVLALAASLFLVLFGPGRSIWQHAESRPQSNRVLTDRSPNGSALPGISKQQPNAGTETTWWVLTSNTLEEIYPPDIRQRHIRQVDRLANDLRPITRSFTAAAAALRRTFPVGRDRTPKGQPHTSQISPDWLSSWS